MRLSRLFLIIAIGLAAQSLALAEANPILYWDNQVLDAARLSRNPPPLAALHIATFHVALFETVNGITHADTSWLHEEQAPPTLDRDAAIASAAYTVLLALWGESSNPQNLKAAYEKALAEIKDGNAKSEGVVWGKKIAELVLAKRAKSGYNKPVPGQYSSNEPGKWRETPMGFRPPVMPHIAKVTPFVMTSPDQFRPPPPHKIDSKECAEEIAYVARVGGRDGADRTEDLTMSTPFWADDLGTATPTGHWCVIAQDLVQRKQLSVQETARLFALLTTACADAGIACWDAKFYYNTWRPETAIREMEAKTNPLVVSNPEFIPNMPSPAHPDYTSGHSTFSGAASRILERYFGTDDIEFSVGSDGLPGAIRSYKKLSEARREVGMSRVYGGIHTMSANLEGQNCGLKIADWVFDHAFQPSQEKPKS